MMSERGASLSGLIPKKGSTYQVHTRSHMPSKKDLAEIILNLSNQLSILFYRSVFTVVPLHKAMDFI